MFEIASLSAFLDIFQRAFGFLEKRKDQRRRLFEEIVDPMYKELSVAIKDYHRFFRNCRDQLSETEFRNWETVLNQKQKEREDIVLARDKVLGLTYPFLSALKKRKRKEDQLLYTFASAIHDFFYTSDRAHYPNSTRVTSLFDLIEDVVSSGEEADKPEVIRIVERTLRNLEKDGLKISAVYGELRVFCLT